jgi:hypothetical protein
MKGLKEDSTSEARFTGVVRTAQTGDAGRTINAFSLAARGDAREDG